MVHPNRRNVSRQDGHRPEKSPMKTTLEHQPASGSEKWSRPKVSQGRSWRRKLTFESDADSFLSNIIEYDTVIAGSEPNERAAARLFRPLIWLTARISAEHMSKHTKNFDLYTFVAADALEAGKPFPLECNYGGIVTIMPPFQDECVICARCESRIKMVVIEGDPGYIIGAEPDGTPKLLPVQGSSKSHPNQLSATERDAILAQVRDQLEKKEQ